jgi:hypothetical protein
MNTKDYADYTFGDIMALTEQEFLEYDSWLWGEWADRHAEATVCTPEYKSSLTGRIAFLKGAGKEVICSIKGK